MKAKKDNKVYQIANDQEKKRYLKEGFDIYGDDGELLEHSPMKKIAYSEYAKLQAENRELREKMDKGICTEEEEQETMDILRNYAREHNIDTGKVSTVRGIVKKIKGYQQEKGV